MTTAAYAEIASPLGIEIGKSTLNDVTAKYKLFSKEESGNEYGYYYKIRTDNIPLHNITSVSINFSNQQIVRSVALEANKEEFESFFESISKKYKLITKNIPFVGSKTASFQADNCKILLSSPHMGFKMSIVYINEEFYNLRHIKLSSAT
jgi:hypothetical protein